MPKVSEKMFLLSVCLRTFENYETLSFDKKQKEHG